MVPSGTPGSFIAAMRQCRSDRQRQHISAAYPRNTLPWQHIDAMRPRGGQVVAIFRRGAFSGGRPWQDFAPMRSRAAGRSIIPPRCLFRALADGRTLAKCVRQRPTVARYRCDAFSDHRPWQLFRFMRSRRGLGREKRPFLAAYRRRASETSRLRRDMRAMHPKSPANGRSGMHRANILP